MDIKLQHKMETLSLNNNNIKLEVTMKTPAKNSPHFKKGKNRK